MKNFILGVCAFAGVAAAIFVGTKYLRFQSGGDTVSTWTVGPTITQLEKLSKLVTTKVSIGDVLIAEGEGYQGSWLIKGDALLAVDLSKAEIVSLDEKKQIATIALPEPSVESARVDHERTKTWDVRKQGWKSVLGFGGDQDKMRDEAMREAQKLVETVAHKPENIEYAKTHAEASIKTFYELVGWRVDVKWQKAKPATKESGS
jgi:hypothetical protein